MGMPAFFMWKSWGKIVPHMSKSRAEDGRESDSARKYMIVFGELLCYSIFIYLKSASNK